MSGRRTPAGFTLIELLVVMAIIALLLMIAAPRYAGSVQRGKEAVLRQNLAATRDAIDQFYADTGRYPESLEDLVTRKYLRALPHDPMTDRNDTWVVVPPPDKSLGDVYDVHSASRDLSRDGTAYRQW